MKTKKKPLNKVMLYSVVLCVIAITLITYQIIGMIKTTQPNSREWYPCTRAEVEAACDARGALIALK